MATKKSPKKTRARSTSSTRTRRSPKKASGPLLSPDAKRDISAVFLAAMAVLLVIGCLNIGGVLVIGMFHGTREVLGIAAYVLPWICAGLAWMLFQPSKYPVRGLNYFGFAGLLIGLAALFHIGIQAANAASQAQLGNGGGLV